MNMTQGWLGMMWKRLLRSSQTPGIYINNTCHKVLQSKKWPEAGREGQYLNIFSRFNLLMILSLGFDSQSMLNCTILHDENIDQILTLQYSTFPSLTTIFVKCCLNICLNRKCFWTWVLTTVDTMSEQSLKITLNSSLKKKQAQQLKCCRVYHVLVRGLTYYAPLVILPPS